tara:strand:+ start:452 stop:580 length:129 start_codon:yes stop_codon:yes gene_type:complete
MAEKAFRIIELFTAREVDIAISANLLTDFNEAILAANIIRYF